MVICFWSIRLMLKITEIKSIYGYFLTLNLSLSYSLCSSCKIDMYICYKLAIYTLYINNPTCRLSIDSTWDASSGRAQSPKKTFVSYTRGSFFFYFFVLYLLFFFFGFFLWLFFFFFSFLFYAAITSADVAHWDECQC